MFYIYSKFQPHQVLIGVLIISEPSFTSRPPGGVEDNSHSNFNMTTATELFSLVNTDI
jgi:hypothetical protein